MTRHIRSSDPRILTRKCCDRLRSVGAYWVVSQRALCSPIYELTAGWRGTEGNNRILRFEPASSTHSVAFNPLDEIRLGTDHETGDMQNLATLIVDPDGKGLHTHWQKTACALMTGCIAHVLYRQKKEKIPATLPAVWREAL